MADSSLVTYSYTSPTHGGSQNPNVGVIHSIESPLAPGYARTLVGPAYFGGTSAGVSIHYLVDPVDTCQGMPENIVCYHVGGGNYGTIGIEQSGYARFGSSEWNTADGRRQQARLAALMADISRRRPAIALRWLTDAQLRAAHGNPGVTGGWATHDQMRRVIGGTTHYDPWNAPNATVAWPADAVMAMARGGATGPAVEDELSAAEVKTITDAITALSKRMDSMSTEVWTKGITGTNPGQHANEMLAAILGGVNSDNAQEAAQTGALAVLTRVSRPMVLVKDSESPAGAVYSLGPGVMRRVSGAQLNAGVASGLWGDSVIPVKHADVAALLQWAESTNGLYDAGGATPPTNPPPAGNTYTVVAGDTWSSIVSKLGVSSDALRTANPSVTDINVINVGQVLTVPKA